ncbi:hypothetical protein Ocin01_04911 [Orchesella cincta]|uniref:Uncharacterized protein n=1 Tax=Orchesella cincta TaxID=48709 RepID=A0A1D2N931_ORCCI|nr:hypothetical protein Ocin01_04911 [Orchesella cincta]
MATAAGNNLGPPPIISLSSPLHPPPPTVQSPSSPSSAAPGYGISGTNGNLRESQAPNPTDLSGIFSVVLNRQQHQQNHHHPLSHHHVRWPSFSMGNRSFWTKYCLLCTVCGSAATILAGIFLVVAALFRYYTTSIYYFETVPTYIPAILLSICGVSTIAFSCKRNRNIILLRITACWSLCSAALSSVITITTSLIHMNRLQTLKECVYTKNPPSCTCYSHSFGMQGPAGPETTHYLFENTPDCDVIHGILYSCLRAVFAISVVAVLLSIFLCMLLYQLIGLVEENAKHERKKAYWSRIRRINSDWSADFIACLARPLPRERSSLLPLMMPGSGSMPMHGGPSILPHPNWGPPPPYEEVSADSERSVRHMGGLRGGICASSIQPTHSFAGTSSGGFQGGGFFNNRSSASFAFPGGHHPRRLRLPVTSHS